MVSSAAASSERSFLSSLLDEGGVSGTWSGAGSSRWSSRMTGGRSCMINVSTPLLEGAGPKSASWPGKSRSPANLLSCTSPHTTIRTSGCLSRKASRYCNASAGRPRPSLCTRAHSAIAGHLVRAPRKSSLIFVIPPEPTTYMVSRTGWILHSYKGVRPSGDPRSSICPAPSPEVSPPQRAVPCRRIRAPAARRLHPLDQKRPWNRGGRDPLQCAPHRVVPYAEQRVSIFAVGEAPAGVIGVRLA